MRFAITGLDDSSEDLDGLLPVKGRILRQIPGPDTPNYFLAVLDSAFVWKKEQKKISHLIIGARWVGGALSPTMRRTPVNIAYVIDQSVLSDSVLDFKKCYYAAIGWADGEEEPNHAPQTTTGSSAPDRV